MLKYLTKNINNQILQKYYKNITNILSFIKKIENKIKIT